jgi:hypothetical protein
MKSVLPSPSRRRYLGFGHRAHHRRGTSAYERECWASYREFNADVHAVEPPTPTSSDTGNHGTCCLSKTARAPRPCPETRAFAIVSGKRRSSSGWAQNSSRSWLFSGLPDRA